MNSNKLVNIYTGQKATKKHIAKTKAELKEIEKKFNLFNKQQREIITELERLHNVKDCACLPSHGFKCEFIQWKKGTLTTNDFKSYINELAGY